MTLDAGFMWLGLGRMQDGARWELTLGGKSAWARKLPP